MMEDSRATTVVASQAVAETAGHQGVFVHTNDPDTNQIIAYGRGGDGSLTRLAAYPTGGRGAAQQGAPADPLASQHSLVHDPHAGLLYVVNAGSDTLSVFTMDGIDLRLRQTVPTGGAFPTSIATTRGLVYVLNAGGAGSVTGFHTGAAQLDPIPGSTRPLGLGNANPPFFLSSPAQLGFTPHGRHLLVTTKNHNQILAYPVGDDGTLSDRPVANTSAGAVPFSFGFDPAGHLIVTEASGSVSSYTVNGDGTLSVISASVPNGQQATCWVALANGYAYAVNAATGAISGYHIDAAGRLRLRDPDGVTADAGGGAIDAATTADGRYLYVQNGATATIHIYRIGDDGSLTSLGEVGGLPRFGGHSGEGIVAL
jgi:6-phosphogluconolactonase (cycloisomerase 2 family)